MEKEKVQKIDYKYCLRCGRLLKSEEAKARGMGKICAQKASRHQPFRLF